jgi:hypothetical protein
MIKILRHLVLLLCLLSAADAAAPPNPQQRDRPAPRQRPDPAGIPFTSPDAIRAWINQYRQRPEPKRLPEAVQAMSRLGVFREIEATGIYVGFMAGVLAANRDDADKLIHGMFPMPPEDQVGIIRAIAYSGLPDWKVKLESVAERMPARRVLIDRFLTGKSLPLDKIGMETGPLTLDTNWGYYFATGDFAAVRRIVGALAWVKEANDLEKLTIAGMSRWTLANNAMRDADLSRYLAELAPTLPKVQASSLRDIVEAAETFEVARVRKDAVASIEELKAKGPQNSRDMKWWTQAGTTLIALGCVVASATGQVQFGLPCIIGGPLSAAAGKYLTPDK